MAKKHKGSTVSAVWEIARPIADSLGLRIWDIRFVKEGADWFLRIFIDKDGGVSIDDCEAMSRAIDAPLDEADPIEQSYCLEVSSPGIERELTRPEHFEALCGQPVCIRLIRPDETGKRELCGLLRGLDGDGVLLEDAAGTVRCIPRKDASLIHAADVFDDQILEGE